MNAKKILCLTACTGLALLFSSCAGYHMGGIPSAQLKGVKTIYVPMVKNESYKPSLQVMATNALIHQLENDGTFHSSRIGSADATLEVTIINFERNSMRRAPDNSLVSEEYQGLLTAKATLINNLTGKKVFADQTFTGKTQYYVAQDAQEGERQALPLAAEDLAREIITQVTNGW